MGSEAVVPPTGMFLDTYFSQLCSHLAASGRVVLALEHRDGTGCACVTRTLQADGTLQYKSIIYYKDEDVMCVTASFHSLIPHICSQFG